MPLAVLMLNKDREDSNDFRDMTSISQSSALLLTLALTSLALLWPACAAREESNQSNRLAVGALAKTQAFNLPINAPTELDFKTKAEIENWRRSCVYQHPELLVYQYQPDKRIFGQIVDGKPWWGLNGQLFFDSGNRSIDGLSEETRFINNPFLLVAANMVLEGYSYSPDRYRSREQLATSALPLDCSPSQVSFYPLQAREDITYNVSKFLLDSARIVELPKQLSSAQFDLVAYNARDFGYNYLAVSPQQSRYISKVHTAPIAINQFIHCGNCCGYPGGCNNMSPFSADLFELTLGALPAQAVIYLWKEKPASINSKADFTVVLNFI